MTGWLLIFSLLILGGILSTLGDRLGTRVGKARLSIFKLRPKSTAVLITVFTGSIISAISFAIMVAFNGQLRVGLFELEDIQAKISERELELKKLEKNLYALRSGDVVISSGQSLLTKTIQIDKNDDIKKEIETILQQANLYAFNLAKTNQSKYRRILLVRKDHIEKLEKIISDNRSWVVSIKSAGNILRGENYVYAFPEITLNKNITKKGEVIAKEYIYLAQSNSDSIRKKIKLLLASTLAEVKRRGSLSSELKINANQINNLGKNLVSRKYGDFQIIAKALDNSQSADKVAISLELQALKKVYRKDTK
ncbi:DUF3084 domain-containing protein [Prochlorococcus marinus]|uniref:DUF3084 domain-containing protein n=1 Tax=Prochlorococcus marinus XMU1408 TaxID=2213228 RepID=A0A318R2K0_PROMR|nr:DUF3084 domain-containing protein [Prochlorococcus marinus]MBW3041305.1 DUF3084 domain-containing protein [Prochlorococcus marinus str. XMU1408]PYE02480.1 DUF3084 domain-containing protein [Prochlorococcus marinus XMU1408]